jgi:hypothetical protein
MRDKDEYVVLDKIVYVAKTQEKRERLKEYHAFGGSEYEKNPNRFVIEVVFINKDKYNFHYSSESERDATFDRLIKAINEYHQGNAPYYKTTN